MADAYEEEYGDELPDTYLDHVDGHWYVIRYDRTLPQLHATDCPTCADNETERP